MGNNLACLAYIEPSSSPIELQPLPHTYVVKDLIPDLTNFYNQYKSIEPWLKRRTPKTEGQKEYLQSKGDRNKLDHVRVHPVRMLLDELPELLLQPGVLPGPGGAAADVPLGRGQPGRVHCRAPRVGERHDAPLPLPRDHELHELLPEGAGPG